MSDKDPIVDLFENKLKNAEFEVDPSVWTNVASQIPASMGTAISTGLSLTSKVIIASAVAATAVITTVAIYVSNNNEEVSAQLPSVMSEEIKVADEEPVLLENVEVPVLKKERATEDKTNNELVTAQEEERVEPIEQQLTIKSVDQIIDKDQIVEEDNLISEFIDTSENEDADELDIQEEKAEETIEFEAEEESKQMDIKIPNVFTPNNDGQNDTYHLTFEGSILDVSVVIFDHKGDVVFKASEADFKWDGRDMRGEPCPSGRYLFMMTGKDENGKEVLESRDFQLLR